MGALNGVKYDTEMKNFFNAKSRGEKCYVGPQCRTYQIAK